MELQTGRNPGVRRDRRFSEPSQLDERLARDGEADISGDANVTPGMATQIPRLHPGYGFEPLHRNDSRPG